MAKLADEKLTSVYDERNYPLHKRHPWLVAQRKCTCDHQAPSLKAIRSVLYNRAVAIELCELGLSAEGIIEWASLELTQHHTGKLIASDFDMVDRDSEDREQIVRFDNLWGGGDGRRFINRYLKRATGEFKNRLKITSVDSVAMLQFALTIYYCRTVGQCSLCHDPCENERRKISS